MPDTSVTQPWHDFYVVMATVAATLVGLLFIGISLHLRIVVSRGDVRTLARVTLANFALLLIASLLAIIPEPASAFGLQLVVSGVATPLLVLPALLTGAREASPLLSARVVILRIALSVLGYAAVILAGALLQSNNVDAGLTALVSATFVLLFVSLRNSWELLVSVGEATQPS